MNRKLVIVFSAIAVAALSISVYANQTYAGLGLAQSAVSPSSMNAIDSNQAKQSAAPNNVVEAEESEKEAWELLGLPYDPNEGETEEANQAILAEDERSEAIEAELARIDAKEGAAFALVMADKRVKAEVKDALDITSDFLPFEFRENTDIDIMTLSVTGREITTGSWETAYTSILSERFALIIEIREGSIVSIEKEPLDDLEDVFTYTDMEKQIIGTALQDSSVQAAVKHKEDSGIGLVVTLRPIANPTINCPPEGCWLIIIRQVDSHATMLVWLNSEEGKVVNTKAVEGW